jgi:hypothetical protein
MNKRFQILFTLACAVTVHAGPRSSANYTLATDTTDAGGTRASSAAYTHDGSVGGVVGISAVSTPAETAKHGYLGQLYEVTGLALSSDPPAEVDEEATAQLAAWHLLDDASYLAVNANSVAWSVVTGPLTGISATGLTTAGTVYQDSPATVRGVYGGFAGTLELTVLDSDPDNYGSYAGDELADSWQNRYFGLNNPNAGPLMDPDGDGQNNAFEFTAGLIPTDALSRFLLRVEPVAGQPTHKRLIFSPRFDDRTYDILTSTTLAGDSWTALTGGTVSDDDTERTVIDPNASEKEKFYRVQVSKP